MGKIYRKTSKIVASKFYPKLIAFKSKSTFNFINHLKREHKKDLDKKKKPNYMN